eukprot:TRINITY_DN14685_c0_g1_i1.p1 TRINITY_DN14685_c0_g1~~TRINITY_DN14685_c0_g1_i1.p1  ORF type:complete len:320 (-),score=62.27 TRINITY_DN14685_c0_g1_i1:123-1082(-)
MRTVFLIACVVVIVGFCTATSASADVLKQFRSFVDAHGKTYKGREFEHRLSVFAKNIERVAELNKMDTATHKLNKFADLTAEEFAALYLSPMKANKHSFPQLERVPQTNQTSWDWVPKGAVTAVKDQGQCGSCWAFSTTGNIEGQWQLAGHSLISLSEQQLVDCDKVDQGCNGGLPSDAYQYIIKTGGVEAESSYKYTAEDGVCKFKASSVVAKISSWNAVSKDESTIADVLVSTGPLSIGINAQYMQFYDHGISNPHSCDPKALDHGVLITGFGVEGSTDFWSIKNSWGADWGEKGYYRIIRGVGKCGLNTMVTTAKV